MMNPSVEVKILDVKVPEVAQRLANSISRTGWVGDIEEVSLLGQLLGGCGTEFTDTKRYNCLDRYLDFMGLQVTEQFDMVKTLKQKFPEVEWTKISKGAMAEMYSQNDVITDEIFIHLISKFGFKRTHTPRINVENLKNR